MPAKPYPEAFVNRRLDRKLAAMEQGHVKRDGTTLSPQRQAFVREYLIDLSPTHAAIRAGYDPARAVETGQLLKKLPSVKAAIDRALASRAKRVGINADRVLAILGTMVLGDPRAIFNADGSMKAPEELNAEDALMIAGVKTRRIVEINPDTGKMHNAEIQEVKLIDKAVVINLAMKHLGMLVERVQLDVTPLAEQLEAAIARRDGGEVVDEDEVTGAQLAAIEVQEGMFIEGEAVPDDGDEEPVADDDGEVVVSPDDYRRQLLIKQLLG